MDYLYFSPGIGNHYPRVPLVARTKLESSCSFAEFPAQRGFYHNSSFNLVRPEIEVCEFLQSWLFFGLISEVLGREVDPVNFRRRDGSGFPLLDEHGNHLITLEGLRSELRAEMIPVSGDVSTNGTDSQTHCQETGVNPWFVLPASASAAHHPAIKRQNCGPRHECLRLARLGLDTIEAGLRWEHRTERLDMIFLSIRVLIESFSGTPSVAIPDCSPLISPAARALRRLMINNGWCIHHWHRVCRTSSLQTSMYLAMLNRGGQEQARHRDCRQEVCKAWSISTTNLPAHVDGCSGCEFVGIAGEEAVAILQKKKIPLVSVKATKTGRLEMKLRGWNGSTPYTAVSRSPAHCLAGPNANSLPTCQLKLLTAKINDASKKDSITASRYSCADLNPAKRETIFWLDNLCMPSRSTIQTTAISDHDMIYTSTLNGMAAAFANASSTLVLDQELTKLSTRSDEILKISLLNFGDWSTSAWNLQERNLSRRMLVALGDGLFDPETYCDESRRLPVKSLIPWLRRRRVDDTVRDVLQDPYSSHKRRMILSEMSRAWAEQKLRTWQGGDLAERRAFESTAIPHAWNLLVQRHVPYSGDLAVLLGNMLGFRTSDILMAGDNAIASIVTSMTSIPVSFLYIIDRAPRTRSISNSSSKEEAGGKVAELDSSCHVSNSHPNMRSIADSCSDTSDDGTIHAGLDLDDVVNRWIPTEIEGEVIGDCPRFSTPDDDQEVKSIMPTLRLEAGSWIDQEFSIYTTFSARYLPRKFVMRDKLDPDRLWTVRTFCKPEDTAAVHTLDSHALGFCFLMHGGAEKYFTDGLVFKGAALAILDHDKSRSRLSTAFYCPIRAQVVSSTDQCRDSAVIHTCRSQPDLVEMSYNRDGLTRLRPRAIRKGLSRHAVEANERQLKIFCFMSAASVILAALVGIGLGGIDRTAGVAYLTLLMIHSLAKMVLRPYFRQKQVSALINDASAINLGQERRWNQLCDEAFLRFALYAALHLAFLAILLFDPRPVSRIAGVLLLMALVVALAIAFWCYLERLCARSPMLPAQRLFTRLSRKLVRR